MFGKSSKQAELIENLDQEFLKIHQLHQLPIGDFPDIDRFKQSLKNFNFSDFPKFSPKLVSAMDEVLAVDLPKLMQKFPQGNPTLPDHMKNPFSEQMEQQGPDPWKWESVERSRYVLKFQDLKPVDGRLSGNIVKPVLMESGLPTSELGSIWALADLTKDGYLDVDEFSLALHLVKIRQAGEDLPKAIPETLLPPKSKV